jgi:hypothetical protein
MFGTNLKNLIKHTHTTIIITITKSVGNPQEQNHSVIISYKLA